MIKDCRDAPFIKGIRHTAYRGGVVAIQGDDDCILAMRRAGIFPWIPKC